MKNNKVEKDVEVIEPDTKVVKSNKDTSKKKTQKVKPKTEKKSLSKKFKETTSELKKVSWPSFSKVAKATGVVIAVAVICTLVLFGIDMLFKYAIYDVLISK